VGSQPIPRWDLGQFAKVRVMSTCNNPQMGLQKFSDRFAQITLLTMEKNQWVLASNISLYILQCKMIHDTMVYILANAHRLQVYSTTAQKRHL